MSGLINSAGSKSGVIGTTELDYEEGTWTPQQKGSLNAPASVLGTYTKIGNKVTVYGSVTFSAQSGSTKAELQGLPFSSLSSPGITYGATIGSSNINVSDMTVYLGAGRAFWYFLKNTGSGPSIDVSFADVGGKYVEFSITYQV